MPDKLKKGWTRVAFGDVVRQARDRVEPETSGLERYVAGEHMDTDDLKIRRWGIIGNGYLGPAFTMRFKPGQVLYGSRRTYLRKVAVPDFEGITANTTFVLESKDPDVLLPELLPFIMQTESFHEHSIKQSKGSVNPYINYSDLTWYEFALPPMDEQRRIAEVLGEFVSCVNAARCLRERLHGVESAVLANAIMERPGVRFAPVADLLLEPPRNGISPNVNSDARGLRTVSISSVADGVFDPEGCIKHVEIDPSSARPFFVRMGDAFAIRGNGNRQLCGRIGMSGQSYDDLLYPDLLIRLRFDPAKIIPDFAAAQWNLPAVHARLLSRAKSSNGIWKVNGQDIRIHTLCVPDIAEQKQVMDRVATLRSGLQEARARERTVADLLGRITAEVWGGP